MTGRKCRAIIVSPSEGYGIGQRKNGGSIDYVLCRFNFPKFPLDKTEVLSALKVNLFSFKTYKLLFLG
jgi:hypothetical protein